MILISNCLFRSVLFLSCQDKVDILGNTWLLWMTISLIFNLHALRALLFFLFFIFFFFKVIYSAMFLNVYSISDCVIPWASMKVINRHSCPIHLPSHTAGGWASTTFRRAKDCGRKEPGSTRVGEGDCGENDQGLKEALELVKLTKSSQQNRYCSLQEFENLSGCYHWSLIGGI